MTQTRKKHSNPKKPKTPTTNVIFIVDESGSMLSVANDVRGGFNAYVEKLKQDDNTYSLTTIKFGTKVRPLFANLPLEKIPALDDKNYTPMDTTALYDAIGHGMAVAGEQWGTSEKPYGQDPVIMIIMTDGFENASREHTKDMITTEMKKREHAGNWTFVYLGADQDAWAIAGQLGFAQGNTMSYEKEKSAVMFSRIATATASASSRRSGQTFGFFDEG